MQLNLDEIEISKCTSKTGKEAEYPKLMISEAGEIILFYTSCEGTVIESSESSGWDIGEFSESWVN